MHESIPNTFESGNEGLNVRDIELWAKYIEDPAGYHEKQVPSERWIINFDSLITRFETKHNLEELHAIIDLKPEESREHVIREPARLDLILVVHRMNFIRDHTDAVQDKHQES